MLATLLTGVRAVEVQEVQDPEIHVGTDVVVLLIYRFIFV